MAEGDVAVVTGAARGIGLGIAGALVTSGCKVAILDIDAKAAEAAAAELARRDEKTEILPLGVDVTDQSQVRAAIADIETTFGQVDILVNNAGIVRDRRFLKMEENDWDEVLATNLKSQFLMSKAAIPGMLKRGYGRIVNISSRAWLGGFGQANYSAAKGGVVSLTRSLAIEFAAHGITVNAIAPGIVDTPLLRSYEADVQERLKKTVPMQRIGTPADIAQAVLFFASRGSSYITGQLIYVCGGRSLSSPSL